MMFDIPLAKLLLAILSFIAGTIVPVLYRKLSFEGVAIKQPFPFRAVRQDDRDREHHEILFGTVVKVANVRKESLLIDEISLSGLDANGARFSPKRQAYEFIKPGEDFVFPLSFKQDRSQRYLPIIIKPDEEWTLAIETYFEYSPEPTKDPVDILARKIESDGLRISFRINGKYRAYSLRIRGDG